MDKLCSIGIHNLEKESNKLIEDKTRLEEAIKDEAVKNFQKFLETTEFSNNLKQEVFTHSHLQCLTIMA